MSTISLMALKFDTAIGPSYSATISICFKPHVEIIAHSNLLDTCSPPTGPVRPLQELLRLSSTNCYRLHLVSILCIQIPGSTSHKTKQS